MQNKNEILNELQSISPLIAGLEKVNVFNVPDGYFGSIAGTVLMSVSEESLLPVLGELNQGDVPAGYFDSLSSIILDKIKNQNIEELPPVFSSINKELLYSIPGNYFQTLPDNIIRRIKTKDTVEEEEHLSPVLAELKTLNPFYIPGNYFESLPGNILKKVIQKTPAKVISMPKRTSIFKYAAAAVITGALALGIYKYSDQDKGAVVIQQTASLDPVIEKGKTMDEKKFNETLNNLSADEIAGYLQRNSSEADIAALSSNIEETNLPNEEDYLLDDKTLDNFLKEIDTKTN